MLSILCFLFISLLLEEQTYCIKKGFSQVNILFTSVPLQVRDKSQQPAHSHFATLWKMYIYTAAPMCVQEHSASI